MSIRSISKVNEAPLSPDAYGSYVSGTPLSLRNAHRDNFIIGLCKCGGPCLESYFCRWCQLSRQYNVLENDTRGLNGCCCVLLALTDLFVFTLASRAAQCWLRGRLRKRYNMKESCCADFCIVLWCPCCALSQTQWELTVRGDAPGATCACAEADVATLMR